MALLNISELTGRRAKYINSGNRIMVKFLGYDFEINLTKEEWEQFIVELSEALDVFSREVTDGD